MNGKLALVILAGLFFSVFLIFQATAHSPEPVQPQSSPTEQPTHSPEPQTAPLPPWLLMLIVFGSVSLGAVIMWSVQKLKHNYVQHASQVCC
jgi:hypothetical protein